MNYTGTATIRTLCNERMYCIMNKETGASDATSEIEMLRHEHASLTTRLLSLYRENMILRQFINKAKQPAIPENASCFSHGTYSVYS